MGGTDPSNFLNTIGKNPDGSGNGDILLWKRKAEKYLVEVSVALRAFQKRFGCKTNDPNNWGMRTHRVVWAIQLFILVDWLTRNPVWKNMCWMSMTNCWPTKRDR